MKMRVTRILLLVFLLSLCMNGLAFAHKVNIFAYVEGGKIYTESYFPDGRPIRQGRVELRDAEDRLLISGVTDDQGLYRCEIPKLADLSIIIIASMGHRNSFMLKKAEIEAGQ